MENIYELNKFLSYIHMGNEVFRVFYDKAKMLNDEKLLDLIVKTEETFKTHEEKISKKIKELNVVPTKRLTLSGKIGVACEKMKIMDTPFKVCQNMIKATNMGMLSALKFLHENNNFSSKIKDSVKDVIDDYALIIKDVKSFVISMN